MVAAAVEVEAVAAVVAAVVEEEADGFMMNM